MVHAKGDNPIGHLGLLDKVPEGDRFGAGTPVFQSSENMKLHEVTKSSVFSPVLFFIIDSLAPQGSVIKRTAQQGIFS